MGIFVATEHKTVHDNLIFSKVLPWQRKASQYCIKNRGNHQLVWFETASTFSLQSRFGLLWFPLVWTFLKFLHGVVYCDEGKTTFGHKNLCFFLFFLKGSNLCNVWERKTETRRRWQTALVTYNFSSLDHTRSCYIQDPT